VVHGALTAGAAGYLSKETERTDICDAVVSAAEGKFVVSPRLSWPLLEYTHGRADSTGPCLSAREHEIMRLTADGLSAPQIAEALGVATSTVKTASAPRLPQARGHRSGRDGRQGAAARTPSVIGMAPPPVGASTRIALRR
jgi:FixJ family two-component response regulator